MTRFRLAKNCLFGIGSKNQNCWAEMTTKREAAAAKAMKGWCLIVGSSLNVWMMTVASVCSMLPVFKLGLFELQLLQILRPCRMFTTTKFLRRGGFLCNLRVPVKEKRVYLNATRSTSIHVLVHVKWHRLILQICRMCQNKREWMSSTWYSRVVVIWR